MAGTPPLQEKIQDLSSKITEKTVVYTLISLVITLSFYGYAVWYKTAAPTQGEAIGTVVSLGFGLFALFGAFFSLLVVTFSTKTWLGNLADMRTYLFIGCLVAVASSAYVLVMEYIAKIFQAL